MAKTTNKYQLGYFEEGDVTSAILEAQRWQIVDNQLFGLFYVLGNGVIEGWEIEEDDDEDYVITISPGTGHIGYVSVQSVGVVSLTLAPDTRNYIYASRTNISAFTREVVFSSTSVENNDVNSILLGYVDTNPIGTTPDIVTINTDDRVDVSFRQQILDFIKAHRHIGGTDNPSKVNLATDVQGYLREDNITDLDASFIATGTIDEDRLPQIDHTTKLTHVGILTHSQLDTFVQILSNEGARLMGEISSVDLLKLTLAVKHVYPEIDDYFINEVAFIPGISPRSLVDEDNTTAVVDYRTAAQGGKHTITGVPAPSTTTFTKAWNTAEEMGEATVDNAAVVGSSIRLITRENTAYIDDFEDVSDWEAITTDLSSLSSSFTRDTSQSSDGTGSGKVELASDDAEMAFLLRKSFNLQDWSSYDKIVFQLRSDSVDHGDLYFYIYDSVAGAQDSYQIVLERNSPTINRDSGNVGWREIVIDVSQYTRTNISAVGFYTSTSSGWNMNSPLEFNIDEMYLTSGNVFVDQGTATFSYGNDFEHVFSAVRWDASIPDGTALSVRTRVSTTADMSSAVWSSFITQSGGSIELPDPSNEYRYIEVEVTLESDTALEFTPQLYALYIDSTTTSSEFTFAFNTEDTWKSGTLSNIDAESIPGSISIKSIGDLGTYLYGTDGSVSQLDSDLEDKLRIFGTAAPKSMLQMLNDEAPGFGQISAIDVGLNDSYVIVDTDNDRVLEVDKNGNVLWGLMGPYFEVPLNPYSSASSSSESLVSSSSSSSESNSSESSSGGESNFKPVGCYYHVDDATLSIMFNDNLENIYESDTFNPLGIFLKASTRRIYLDANSTTFKLFGIDEEHVDLTPDGTTFFAGSNVLQAVLSEADAVTLSGVTTSEDPYLVVSNPSPNKVVTQSSLRAEFTAYNCTIGSSDYGIRVQLDGGEVVDLRSVSYKDYTGLSNGSHALTATLIDSNGNPVATSEATVTVRFYVSLIALTEPIVSVNAPLTNQIVSSGDVSVEFTKYNVPAGYHLRYTVDGGSAIEYRNSSPLVLESLSNGEHTVRLYLSDINNNVLSGLMTDVSVVFVVGGRSEVTFSLSVGRDSVKSSTDVPVADTLVDVDVNKVRLANIRSPIDAQLIHSENAVGDANTFNVLVGKVPTPSYLNYYAEDDDVVLYQDGHSVVEFAMDGSVVLSDNTAGFAANKALAKRWLGSVHKYGPSELFIADALNKRALVVELDTTARTSSIVWSYVSERVISDFNRVPDVENAITIDESGLSVSTSYIRRDLIVTWRNDTSETIRILSGATTYNQFYADPDFNFFGSEFDSGDILPGEYFTHRFINLGTYNYFVYPYIFTGKISVVETSITPNDQFVLAENDPSRSSYLNRVIKIDAWGNIIWSFGESFTATIKDAKPTANDEVIITV